MSDPRLRRGLRVDLTPDWLAAIEAWEVWLRAAGRAEGTAWLRSYHVRRAAAETLRDVGPWDVTMADLVAVLSRADWAPETRKSARSSLRSFYSWAVDDGRIEVDPARKLPSIAIPAGRPKPTPDDVLDRALATARGKQRLMLMLAGYAGLRRAEIAAVHSDDLVGDRLRVEGKGGKVRMIPLHPKLVAALQGIDGWAFPGRFPGTHLTANNVGVTVRRLLGGGYGAHTLRHRFATKAYAVDRDILSVQQLLGHSKPETTMRYTQLPDDALRAAVLGVA